MFFLFLFFFKKASDCVTNNLNKNKFLLPYLQSVVLVCTLTSKNVVFICLGEISFFRLKNGFVFEFYTL